ncbi:CotH kinase family protein [Fibrobacter sp. UWB10]|uniref:CotH kinase family protein n=1 Tax=Fibrobacter sp. UWB10 TaxID=1896201 RepID=UPI0024036ACF|nr:CotH kinase family protein [Fibrobacter sp. UWB10]SMP40346.1 CotH protein [Fibrobacter sp. UWB10]
MRYHFAKQLPLFLSLVIGSLFLGCSNSEGVDQEIIANWNIAEDDATPLSAKLDYLPLDDSEYPYAGIPRIVIETENHREIKDRETEIPARLQIWGEHAPESEVMELTIRGRGNTSWGYPKKPYAIKFEKKQAFLGMPKSKKWVMLANYRDRTLIRNAVAFEIARQTSQEWVPQGRFAEIFLNKKFIGNYYICEKIEIKKEKLDLDSNSFLLEFDTYFDETNKFRSAYRNFPINIKQPKDLSDEKFNHIRNYIDSIECSLYGECSNNDYKFLLDLKSLASFWIVQEVTQNPEVKMPKSVYAYKDTILKFGPVWDFDWQTFTTRPKGLIAKNALWLQKIREKREFQEIIQSEWAQSEKKLQSLTTFIDSLANYTQLSNERNFNLWGLKLTNGLAGDEEEDFSSAIQMMKQSLLNRLEELHMFWASDPNF